MEAFFKRMCPRCITKQEDRDKSISLAIGASQISSYANKSILKDAEQNGYLEKKMRMMIVTQPFDFGTTKQQKESQRNAYAAFARTLPSDRILLSISLLLSDVLKEISEISPLPSSRRKLDALPTTPHFTLDGYDLAVTPTRAVQHDGEEAQPDIELADLQRQLESNQEVAQREAEGHADGTGKQEQHSPEVEKGSKRRKVQWTGLTEGDHTRTHSFYDSILVLSVLFLQMTVKLILHNGKYVLLPIRVI